jgi:hypothetical protein
MVRLESRLSRLEAQRPVDRCCAHCRTWPSWRVIYREEGQHAPAGDRPGRCPICGWESNLVVVTYIDEGSMAADPTDWDTRSGALKAARSGGSEW